MTHLVHNDVHQRAVGEYRRHVRGVEFHDAMVRQAGAAAQRIGTGASEHIAWSVDGNGARADLQIVDQAPPCGVYVGKIVDNNLLPTRRRFIEGRLETGIA